MKVNKAPVSILKNAERVYWSAQQSKYNRVRYFLFVTGLASCKQQMLLVWSVYSWWNVLTDCDPFIIIYLKFSVSTLQNIKKVKTAEVTWLNAGRRRMQKYYWRTNTLTIKHTPYNYEISRVKSITNKIIW